MRAETKELKRLYHEAIAAEYSRDMTPAQKCAKMREIAAAAAVIPGITQRAAWYRYSIWYDTHPYTKGVRK